ncbi:emopamil binding protein-like protein [Gonapodya prolifera JEL478]|uniref:Emopamil binding protein-like protein n=1 Tax=Gonapodya prolifera (strain JEL478) TaxID=1344416 RepID=A0A138ZXE5_GONPJ|nr:emopamil binding protein-like protein [Gonapodya prolifera JEL478]|eukprot:KXS09177.1 emopamil binding protein-like protein [Gonapodya prolifera JEL478]
MDEILNSGPYLVATLAMLTVAYVGVNTANPKLNTVLKAISVWYAFDSIMHLTFELGYTVVTLQGGASKFEGGFFVELWKEYGKADARWAVYDPTILSLELLTAYVAGPLAAVCLYGTLFDKPWRHFAQIVLNVAELYGGWMTFAPEWVNGSPALNTSNPIYLWLYLVFFNGLWVVIPFFLLYESFYAVVDAQKALQKARATSEKKSK